MNTLKYKGYLGSVAFSEALDREAEQPEGVLSDIVAEYGKNRK